MTAPTFEIGPDGFRLTCRDCADEKRIPLVFWERYDDLPWVADQLAEKDGWHDHQTCAGCGDKRQRNVNECNDGDAERLERSLL